MLALVIGGLMACDSPADSGDGIDLSPVYYVTEAGGGPLPSVVSGDNGGRLILRTGSLLLGPDNRFTSESVYVRERWLDSPDTVRTEEVLRGTGTYALEGDTLFMYVELPDLGKDVFVPDPVQPLQVLNGGQRLEGRSYFGVPFVLEPGPVLGP